MISLEDYRGLNAERRRTLTILTFWPDPVGAADLSSLTTDADGHCILVEKTRKYLSAFLKNGWIDYASRDRRTLFMQHPVARAAYEEMIREADEKGWWPRVEVAGKKPDDDLFPELHRARYARTPTEPSDAMLVSEGIRLVALGSGAKASALLKNMLAGRGGISRTSIPSFARAIAACAASRFGEEPQFGLTDKDPLLVVMPAWFSACFIEGRGVTVALENLNRILVAGGSLPTRLVEAYCALCVWSGRMQHLSAVGKSNDSLVYGGCLALASGNFKAAELKFKKSELGQRPKDGDGERDLDNLPVRFLLAMSAAVVKPEKIAKNRPAGLMCVCSSRYGYSNEFRYAAKNMERFVDNLGNTASRWWFNLGNDHRQLDAIEDGDPLRPLSVLLAAWDYSQTKVGRKNYALTVRKIWNYAKELDKLGWSSLTNLLSTLLAGGFDQAADAAYLDDLDGRSLRFLQRQDPTPEWKGLLEALRKTIPKRQNFGADDGSDDKRFLWSVSLKKEHGEDLYSIEEVRPATRYEFDHEDGRDDEVLDVYDLEKKGVRKLMSEKDVLIANALYGLTAYGKVDWHELMKYLSGAPNLVRRDRRNSWSDDEWKPATPMSLEICPCELSTTVGEDGSLVLQAPEWAFGCESRNVIRVLGKGRYGFVEISPAVKKILDVFDAYGAGGRISIPREGLQQAESIIEGLSSVMPLAEPSEVTEDLRRVPAVSALRLRLDYAEGVLLVRAVVLPIPDNSNLTLDPAYGPVEKLVAGAAASFVLVRDLAAEKAAFEPVCTALAEFEGAFDGKSSWRFDDLADAIAALAKLKALGDAAPLEWIQGRRLSVAQAPKSGVKLTSQRTADEWFRVEGSFELDDGRVLSIIALLDAARSRRGNFVKLSDGDYVALTSSMAKELDALNAAGRRKGDGVEIVKAAIPMLDGVFGEGEDSIELPDAMAVTAKEIRAAFAKRPGVPRTLNAELRPYQEDGYRWLSRLAACGFGSCLADDMGLGKTIQVISLLLERAKNGASLVIAPSSVCGNWRREIERFAPTLHPVMALEETETLSAAGPHDVVIASYGYLLFHEDDFASVTWNGLVLDEAQAIKNDASKRAKAVKRLHAKFRIAATGTPVENRLGELWSLFDFLNPGLLGPAASFAQRFTADGKAVPELKRLVKPLILRRLKGDVLDDLPDKTEVTIPVVLSASERTAYEACRQQALAQLAAKAQDDGAANRMSILAELTRLRRFCCHPSLVLPGMGVPSAKMEALVELLEGLHEGRHRALVFSQFTDYLALVRKTLDAHKWTHLYLDGSTPTLEREKLVNAFQGGEGDFFLISLKAGGTGLNLTAANYVILLDPWWNPAVENQAADRAHRIGQKNPVTVYRLISSDTVEARVIELHQEKKAIAEDVLEGTSSTSLSPAQLMKLFT